ncbi:MAG: hypothetical protein EPO52_17660 [Herbiconiux sp.]|uniref:hypothetical protein n=1 Tax=Herbiconiux sp. TaxID=1871186 RepID=UPI00122640C3|nr:hypothetical protein [Herbiconiux sp.]TAJ46360.1 MAG: hypothetical protein EPO52_17660 [Herbiconiux sp.]
MTSPIDDFDAILDAAESAERAPVELEVALGDQVVTFEFIPMDGLEYSDLVATHPPRPTAQTDAGVGFNSHAAVRDLPVKYIRRVVDGERREITQEQWDRAFSRFLGRDVELAATCLWGVNFYTPNARVQQLKKA